MINSVKLRRLLFLLHGKLEAVNQEMGQSKAWELRADADFEAVKSK